MYYFHFLGNDGYAGSVIENDVPVLAVDFTVSVPPWASIIFLDIGSPSPLPFVLYEIIGVNIFSNCSGFMPHPLS